MRPTLGLFAVEDTTAQFTWRGLGRGELEVRTDRGTHRVRTGVGAGAWTLRGLRPGARQEVTFRHDPSGATSVLRFDTLRPPPGEELYRLATMSDLHLGVDHFGYSKRMREDAVTRLHPGRCAEAARDEALAWGASRLVLKGDVVHSSHPHTWAEAADLLTADALADAGVAVDLICGNHDVNARSTVDPHVEARRYGLDLHRGVHPVDVPGVRLVMMDSSVPGIDIGRWNHLRHDATDAVADAGGPALLIVHHHPQPLPFPVHPPKGIPSGPARRFLRSVRRANPALFGTSGHTHRHRRRKVYGVDWSEVGSVKDYPGVWAGYVVHEGGIRQVVRRVERPDCIAWTDYSRLAAGGAWGLWSPGTIGDRCFTLYWPTR